MMDDLNFTRESPVFFNIEDLNRIEEWTAYLAGRLTQLGYPVSVQTAVWDYASVPWRSEIDRIRRNVLSLQKAYRQIPAWRDVTFTESLDFDQANALEWNLHTVYRWLSHMTAGFFYAGECICGEDVFA